MPAPPDTATEALQRSVGALSTAAMARMDGGMPWFRELGADERSWVGLIVQAAIRGFVQWYRTDTESTAPGGEQVAASVFGAAPRALTGAITLQQTVDMVRLGIDVVEENIDTIVRAEDAPKVHAGLLRYAREVAFATAEVYARAAEVRGAWDARLEALLVDSVLRAEPDEAVLSQASALGWAGRAGVAVVLGALPAERTESDLFEEVRRLARAAGMDTLCAAQGDRLVVVLGGVEDDQRSAEVVADLFGPGPVVVGPVTADLSTAHLSARAAMSARRAAPGWPEASRPVRSVDLLPERALAGDGHARRHLVEEVYLPLLQARGTLIETLGAYFGHGRSIEAAARALFVHPNTVRYRLNQAAEITGLTPTDPRHGFTYQIALVLGRQSGRGDTRSL